MVTRSDRSFWIFNAVVSTVAVGFLGWLLLLREAGGVDADLRFMPGVNAALNATSASLFVVSRVFRTLDVMVVACRGCRI